jgi:uncharacterized protein
VKVVLDTNIVVSGAFFGGAPRAVLDAWGEGRFELMISPSIVDEYVRILERIGASHPGVEYQAVLTTILGHGTLVPDRLFPDPVTADPDDDMFMLCAEGADATVVSGDKHLLDVSGWRGVEVLQPRTFLERLTV